VSRLASRHKGTPEGVGYQLHIGEKLLSRPKSRPEKHLYASHPNFGAWR
jgi:hypothetical protein